MKDTKLLTILLLLTIICFSCKLPKRQPQPPVVFGRDNCGCDSSVYIDDYRVIVIDSCEYIAFKVRGDWIITHKGNCKFCAARKSQYTPINKNTIK